MNSPKAPTAPDPTATAQAQAGLNRDTAVTQYGLQATNQVTPDGSLNYSQIGTWADGTPRFQATTTLSPTQQSIYDQSTNNQQAIGRIGGEQIGRIGDLLGSPVNIGNEATEARLYDLGSRRLDPQFAQRRTELEDQLNNRGIRLGSEAYNSAVGNFDQARNDAYNQLLLQGRGQAVQESLTERNQPINEITALMNGSQVSQPNFASTPTPGVAPVDYTGTVNSNYQGALQQYNTQNQANNAMLGGLFGLASAPLTGWASGGFSGLPKMRSV